MKKRAAIQVKNKNELKQNIQFLLKNEKIQKEIGQKAYSVIKSQQNATSKNLKLILELL
jgi:3-deoxy-D-manno-octulosonic-acid transferase